MGADRDFIGRMAPELELLLPGLDERSRRLVLGAVARAAGDGGVTAVAQAAGASWRTVADGAGELASGDDAGPGRVRRAGGGRKKPEERDPRLIPALRELLEASTRGDRQSLITWTALSVRGVAAELTAAGHRCARSAALRMLHAGGFSTQGNSRTAEGKQHPGRDAQFRCINDLAKRYLAAGDPVISIGTKKKELAGLYAQRGRKWRPKGDPRRVRDHDFPDPQGGKAIPYGVYDIGADAGFVSAGTESVRFFVRGGFLLPATGCLSGVFLSRYLKFICPVYVPLFRNRAYPSLPGQVPRVRISRAIPGACCLILLGSRGGCSPCHLT